MKILIAEDDPISQRILENTLLDWGYDPVVTTNGFDAWRLLASNDAPCLAILDIEMPGMDGLELCRKVRALAAPLPPYLILLTSLAGKTNITNGIRAGANDYLTKPFHRDELGVRIANGFRILELQSKLTARVNELELALVRVKTLEGLLAICSYCKKIRNEENHWKTIDSYIAEKTDVQFSHGICPVCYIEAVRGLDNVK